MTAWTRTIAAGLAVATVPVLSACAQQPVERTAEPSVAAPSVHPVSGLEIIPLTVTTAAGTRTFAVELAATPEEQARGLMFRTEMGPDEGMIFPNDPPEIRSFWMRNTVIPLDIIFIGPDRKIINIAADTVPYSEASVRSEGHAIAVLELNAGRSAALGIKPGDRVEW